MAIVKMTDSLTLARPYLLVGYCSLFDDLVLYSSQVGFLFQMKPLNVRVKFLKIKY